MHKRMSEEELAAMNGSQNQSTSKKQIKCAMCEKRFVVTEPRFMPFCSQRCQQLDLAGWLNEDYGLPFEGDKTGQEVEYLDENGMPKNG